MELENTLLWNEIHKNEQLKAEIDDYKIQMDTMQRQLDSLTDMISTSVYTNTNSISNTHINSKPNMILGNLQSIQNKTNRS